jgi:hypothetical protein
LNDLIIGLAHIPISSVDRIGDDMRGGDQQPRAAYEERRADASHSLFAIRYGDDRHNAFAQDGPDRSTYRRGLGYDNIVTDSKRVLPRSFWAQNGASHFVL